VALSNVFDIAGSGMAAQSVRLNTVSSNIANAESVSSTQNETYRARHPVFSTLVAQSDPLSFADEQQASAGVRVAGIVESQVELRKQYQPDHPQADDDGYVYYPNVNAFATNVEIMNTAKQMLQRVLTLGQ